MAAQFAKNHRSPVQGVVLWGAYPGVNSSLLDTGQAVLVVYGTSDCLTTPEEILAATVRLPETTDLVPIEDGNHTRFGWYERQIGSCSASISREDQQAIAIEALTESLAALNR